MKHSLIMVLMAGLALTACSKKADAPATEAKVALSPECQKYIDTLKSLSEQDENLKKMMNSNLDKVAEEWSTLSKEEQEKFTKQCANMDEQLKKITEQMKQ